MLADDIARILPQLRAEAEARMTSTARVRRNTGRTVQDETTGRELPEWLVTHASLPGRLAGRRGAATSRTDDGGGVDIERALREWHCPIGTPNVIDGDLLEITAGESAGQVFRVVESDRQDQATALRLPVISVDRPAEW